MGDTHLYLGGLLGSSSFQFSNLADSGTLTTTLDSSALTLRYDSVSILTGGASGIMSGTVTTGLGQTSLITANITFDPFSYSLANFGTSILSPWTGGNYKLSGFGGTSTLNFSGSYSITDGTNTYNGTFTKAISTPWRVNDAPDVILYTGNYPNSIQISRSGVSTFRFFDYPSNATLFSQQFGSTNVAVTVDIVAVQTGNTVTLSVPEPSSYGLFALGASALGLRRIRTTCRQ